VRKVFLLFSCLTTNQINEYSDYKYSIDLDFSQKDPSRPFIGIAINNDTHLAFFDTGASVYNPERNIAGDLILTKEIRDIGVEKA